ncbi:hypothetical protein GUJ93_ZPchr0004g40336 [Zizania palustris]|uniref:Terpene synthase metal-binding domain-containing protein n=1 Tax=Zizania palustris TaxID=103762 RepID=A0A8J5VF61_ZIZPA|nr:hypothetical protein GUJ93_ZPchr0004g40336 [Zizania palustris]
MAVSNNTEEATTIEASVWGEFFINYEPKPLQRSEQWMVERANKLKEDVSTRLQTCNDLVERMHLVDAIQRLGIDHLFKKDICGILSVINGSEFPSSNLHDVATRFLLLREHGFWVSSDAFKKFRGSDGRWSKDLYGHIELNYARDRAVENYATAYILFHEEGLGLTRLIFAKICALIVIMDDTYDSHATIEECRKLNEAIQRWDETAIPLLPDYLKKFYCKILNIFKESEDQLTVNEKYRVSYAKKEFQNLSTYYLQEAEWSHQDYKPSFKEQVELSTMSSTVPLLTVAGMLGSGEAVTNEAFQWAASHPSCVIACAKIMRFMNDIAAFKCRKSKGDVASSLECYIDEHQVTSKEAIAKFDSLIEDEWRTLNKARYECSSLLPAVQLVVNIAVAFAFFYDGRKDAYTFTIHFQEVIDNLFVKPIPI